MCGSAAPRSSRVSLSRPTGAAATRSGGAGLSGVQNDDGFRRYWGGPPGINYNPHGNSDREIAAQRERKRQLEIERKAAQKKPGEKKKPKPKKRTSLITPPPSTPPPAQPTQSLIVPSYGQGAFGGGRDFLRRTG